MRTKRIGFLIFISIVIIYLLYNTFLFFRSPKISVKEGMSNEYLNLFNTQKRKEISIHYSYDTKVNFPISSMHYKTAYIMMMGKWIIGDKSLKDFIKESIDDNGLKMDKVNSECNGGSFILRQSIEDSLLRINHAYFPFFGSGFKTIVKNDSVAYYKGNFESFGISVLEKESLDILVKVKDEPLPVNILFLKRNKSLYFFVLTVYDPETKLPENLLYDLIKDLPARH